MSNNVNDQARGGKRGLIFTSWNIRGVNNPVKRGKVLAHLKSLNSDIERKRNAPKKLLP